MPAIGIEVLEGVFTVDEKARVIQGVTDAFAEVAGQTIRAGTSVRIHEIKTGAWCYAGEVLATEIAQSMTTKG